MRSKINLGIVIICGLIVLPGYFFNIPVLTTISQVVLKWAVIVAGVALLVGMGNLARVHWLKVVYRRTGYAYSLILLVSLGMSLVIGLADKPTGEFSSWLLNYVLVPSETSLIAILAVLLIYTAARISLRQTLGFSILFLGVVVLMLAGMVNATGYDLSYLTTVRTWLTQVGSIGGMRGLLLGVALGTIAAGLRIFMGADRPYER